MSTPSLTLLRVQRRPSRRLGITSLARFGAVLGGVALVLTAPPLTLGARLELLLNPVLQAQAIPPESVTRVGDRLCWTWTRDKLRAPEVLDIDVVLAAQNGDRSYPEVFDDVSGVPWHRGGALPPGHYESRFCIQWPKFLPQDEAVALRQTVQYAGFLGLWNLRVGLPDIVAH